MMNCAPDVAKSSPLIAVRPGPRYSSLVTRLPSRSLGEGWLLACHAIALAQEGHLSHFTRRFFLTNNHTPRDTIPRTKATAAHCRGPTGPNLVVMNVIVGSGTKNRKADKIKNITALMMNESGSIRLPPGISSFSTRERSSLRHSGGAFDRGAKFVRRKRFGQVLDESGLGASFQILGQIMGAKRDRPDMSLGI